MLDLGGDERVVANDPQLLVGDYEGSCDVAALRLSCVGAEPVVEARVTTLEPFGDADLDAAGFRGAGHIDRVR